MRYLAVLLFSLSLFGIEARGQALVPPSLASTPTPVPRVDIPRRLTLDRAEEILLQNNLALTAARYGVEVAQAQRLIAGLRPNPIITFGAEQIDFTGSELTRPFRNWLSTNSDSAANRLYTFRYDYIVERGSKREFRSAVAQSQLQAAESQLLDATRQQLFQLKQAFYAAVLARENVRVADENLYLINSTEQLVKLHVDTGDTAEWELIKFQANKVQYQRDLVAAQLGYQQSVRDVLNLLGAQPSNVVAGVPVLQAPVSAIPVSQSAVSQAAISQAAAGQAAAGQSGQGAALLADAPIEVLGDLALKPVDLILAELRKAALDHRPDVAAARYNLQAAEHALQLAEALRHRDIDVAGEYQRVGGENTVGVTVSVPLFLHNNHQAEISAAAAQLAQARTTLSQVELQAETDVDKAFKAYEISRRMVQVYTTETVAKAEESFRIAGVSYKEGATSMLELQDAQRTYNQTRVAYNQTHLDYRMSLFQLELATATKITN